MGGAPLTPPGPLGFGASAWVTASISTCGCSMLGWAAGPAGGQAPAALRGERYGPLPPSGWPDKVPPADLIPCGGKVWDRLAALWLCLVVEQGHFWAPHPKPIPPHSPLFPPQSPLAFIGESDIIIKNGGIAEKRLAPRSEEIRSPGSRKRRRPLFIGVSPHKQQTTGFIKPWEVT